MFWKLAEVKLSKSNDGITRSAKVKVVNSETGKATVLRRPIQHLVPLELHLEPDKNSDVHSDQATDDAQAPDEEKMEEIRSRPRRKAAMKGEIARRNQGK